MGDEKFKVDRPNYSERLYINDTKEESTIVDGILGEYLNKFVNLNVDKARAPEAPNKPILLLSILSLIEKGILNTNEITLTDELIGEFDRLWAELAPERTKNIVLPFWHLQNDGFWHIHFKEGMESHSNQIRGLAELKETINHAFLDEGLFELLQDAGNQLVLNRALLSRYFDMM